MSSVKYKCKFNKEWTRLYLWLKAIPEDIFSARCSICPKTFSIAETGIGNIKRHAKSKTHQNREAISRGETSQQILVINEQQALEVSKGK